MKLFIHNIQIRLMQILFRIVSRHDSSSAITRVPGLGSNMWNYVAVTYDYDSGYRSVYVNGTVSKSETFK